MFGLNKEAALIIGTLFTIVTAAATQLSGPGIFTDDPGATFTNVATILVPIIAGAITRYQVYSKNSVEQIQATAAATGEAPKLPSPP